MLFRSDSVSRYNHKCLVILLCYYVYTDWVLKSANKSKVYFREITTKNEECENFNIGPLRDSPLCFKTVII